MKAFPSSVAVVVPSWNGRRHLETCLAALRGQGDPGRPWSTWVLDNGSSDGTSEWIEREHPEVRVVRSPANLGFAAGVDRLVEVCEADAVAVLNNDTRPEPEWLAALVDGLGAGGAEVAAVSGKIVDWEGDRLDFGRGIVTFDGHAFQLDFRRPLREARIPSPGEELAFACGGNMIVRRDVFRRLGGFDPDFFAYFEDVDLGWRIWSAGYRIAAAPEAVVHHRSAATSDRLGASRRGLLFERNAFVTAFKNYDETLWHRVQPAILLTLLARTTALLSRGNPGGELIDVDPYARGFADTAAGGETADPSAAPSRWSRLREAGIREGIRRAIRKLGRILAGIDRAEGIHVIDPRSIAQLRAVAYVVGNLDRTMEKRQRVQSLRRRPDREILERFPRYLVPTYPGDEELFAGEGFRRCLPDELPLVEATIDDVMAVEGR